MTRLCSLFRLSTLMLPLLAPAVPSLCVAGTHVNPQPFAMSDGAAQAPDSKDGAKGKSAPDSDALVPASRMHNAVLWAQPASIASLDLYAGMGGAKHAPQAPFTFVEEAKSGTNPKFDVKDADGKKWRVKLGEEAQPEVVASRLLWAVGYFVNEDYLLPTATVANLKLKRGDEKVKNGEVENARFARKPAGERKIGIWAWKDNPFAGKREFNGLRVMMAVLNNWDLKDVNNAVYSDSKTGQQVFLVSDVGATFGSNGLEFSKARAKGNIASFKGSKFVTKVTATTVSFGTPSAPTGVFLASLGASAKSYAMRRDLQWIGRDIPIEDARWMGGLLAQLSHQQLVDAFRAGNFPAEAIEDYVEVVESRVAELKELSPKL